MFTDVIVVNNGISSPLCSKKGLICSINGLTARESISSILPKELSSLVDIGSSKLLNGYTVIEPLSANSQAIKYCMPSKIMLV